MLNIVYKDQEFKSIPKFVNYLNETLKYTGINNKTISNLVSNNYLPRKVMVKYPDINPKNGDLEIYRKSKSDKEWTKLEFNEDKLTYTPTHNELVEGKIESINESIIYKNYMNTDSRVIIYDRELGIYGYDCKLYTSMSELANDIGTTLPILRYHITNRDTVSIPDIEVNLDILDLSDRSI